VTNCIWRPHPNGFQCTRCGKIKSRETRRNCAAAQAWYRRLVRYLVAIYRWAKSGFARRWKWQIERIYQEHCLPCEQFDAASGGCKKCGCRVNRSESALRNKIAMRSESCPLGKW